MLTSVSNPAKALLYLRDKQQPCFFFFFFLASLMTNLLSASLNLQFPKRYTSGNVGKGTSRTVYLNREELHWMCLALPSSLGIWIKGQSLKSIIIPQFLLPNGIKSPQSQLHLTISLVTNLWAKVSSLLPLYRLLVSYLITAVRKVTNRAWHLASSFTITDYSTVQPLLLTSPTARHQWCHLGMAGTLLPCVIWSDSAHIWYSKRVNKWIDL